MNTKTKEIDNINYHLEEFKATKRIVLQFKYGKVFAGFMDSMNSNPSIQAGFFDCLSSLDPQETASMLKELVQSTITIPLIKDDEKFDDHFQKHYEHLIPLAFDCFELNYGKSVIELKKKLVEIGILSPKSSEKDISGGNT